MREPVHDFEGLVHMAAGHAPYPYQRRLAEEGLPELLAVPTGTGKTLAATLGWLWRHRFHPDPGVRASTPRWLVFVLPMRVLVEQTRDAVAGWLRGAGLEGDVGLHVVMGGEGRQASQWRTSPERDAVFVGTLDMLLSRALNRGYGASRFAWPIDFGLFNSGCHWVFDEVQLMGPALPTSRQLEGLRRSLGTAVPSASMWMSATVDLARLDTVDLPAVGSKIELDAQDREGDLARRLNATKTVRGTGLDPRSRDYPSQLAGRALAEHREGTLTLVVVNTVERAREAWLALRWASAAPQCVLLHSRFRPGDRAARLREALEPIGPNQAGRIVVTTQVLEAGVDISAATLITELAPWPSIVQRAGRCNRDGESDGARMFWAEPPSAAPYEPEDCEASRVELDRLEGMAVSAPGLGAITAAVREEVHPVLRRRDLIDLFDTTPDLSGNDLDVSRFIRQADDLDVLVAWRDVAEVGPGDDAMVPTTKELCPVPVNHVREALRRSGASVRRAWGFDHLGPGWIRCFPEDVRPGQVLILRAHEGGYDPLTGWDPKGTAPVPSVPAAEPSAATGAEEATEDDLLSFPRAWVRLRDHLQDAERACRDLIGAIAPIGLTPEQVEATAVAAGLHDLGKVHPCFQEFLLRSARTPEENPPEGGPWAKSGGTGRPRHSRRYFRHELASALALLARPEALTEAEPDLVAYLVAAHHGRVRLAIRSLPGEAGAPGFEGRVALGIHEGEALPETDLPRGQFPATVLDLSPMQLGEGAGGVPSWTARALALRDRPDLGPFRLAFLEAVVRLADWRVSADPTGGPP